jgi:hypothetical protein
MATQGAGVNVNVPATAAVVQAEAGGASSGGEAAAAGTACAGSAAAVDLLAAASAQFVALGGGADKVKSLVAQSHELAIVKKKLGKDLKNARKRQSRLKAKARELSVNDLMDVLVLRAQKDSSRGQNAAQDAAAPTQADAAANLAAGVS